MRVSEIGQQLRAYRLESGLCAEEIAGQLRVSRAALYRYEKGEVIKLDTVQRLAELLKLSPLTLLGIGVDYYSRAIEFFGRLRQIEGTADQVLQVGDPLCYLTTSETYDQVLTESLFEAADEAGEEAGSLHALAEQVLGILSARKQVYKTRRPGIIAILPETALQRLLQEGIAGSLSVNPALRARCRAVAAAELEAIAVLLETEPMGLQFSLLPGAEPTTHCTLVRQRDHAILAINPFRSDCSSGTPGVALVTGAQEAVTTHQRVVEGMWRDSIKGPAAAQRVRTLLAAHRIQ